MKVSINIGNFYDLINFIMVIIYYAVLLIICFLIAFWNKNKSITILCTILLYFLLITILNSFGKNILIPTSQTTYPGPPTTGLDGISKVNRFIGIK